MKNVKDQKNEKLSLSIPSETKERYMQLYKTYKCTHAEFLSYLLSLENFRTQKGAIVAEKRLKQWLLLGFDEEITSHKLRNASDYDNKNVGLRLVLNVMELYEQEIKEHNSKFQN